MTFTTNKRMMFMDYLIYSILFLVAAVCILPFFYVISVSLTDPATYVPFQLRIIPKDFSLDSYKYLLRADSFTNSLKNSVFITVVGTMISLAITFSFAFGISKKTLPGRKFFNIFIIITLLFNAGIIPNYILVKNLHLTNSLWALILTMMTSAWDVIVVRTFISGIPAELEEAATVEGCNDLQFFAKIVIPLSKPAIASYTLIFAVLYWNVYFYSMLYISDPLKWTLQVLVKSLIVDSSQDAAGSYGDGKIVPIETIRYAAVVLSMLPILVVYPFLQKYFVSGLTVGAVKG